MSPSYKFIVINTHMIYLYNKFKIYFENIFNIHIFMKFLLRMDRGLVPKSLAANIWNEITLCINSLEAFVLLGF
jgi:hypothetical protein